MKKSLFIGRCFSPIRVSSATYVKHHVKMKPSERPSSPSLLIWSRFVSSRCVLSHLFRRRRRRWWWSCRMKGVIFRSRLIFRFASWRIRSERIFASGSSVTCGWRSLIDSSFLPFLHVNRYTYEMRLREEVDESSGITFFQDSWVFRRVHCVHFARFSSFIGEKEVESSLNQRSVSKTFDHLRIFNGKMHSTIGIRCH